jgi:hypothetical protein
MIYLELDVVEFPELEAFYLGIKKVFIERNSKRRGIEREIGVDSKGRIIHKFPGDFEYGNYGLQDQIIGFESLFEKRISKDEFVSIWESN